MLQALIRGKHQRFNEEGVSVWLKEDTLTACVFERVRYLPEQYIKNVFSAIAASNEEQWAPTDFGRLQRVRFWPRFKHPDGGSVEPDVLFEFEKLLLIVEAKRWDSEQQQYIGQWNREIAAVSHSHPDAAKKPRKLLAVGGNLETLARQDVWSTTWSDFGKTVKKCCGQTELHIRALVEGIEHSLRLHDIEMRDPVYLEDLAKSITPLNMSRAQPFLTTTTFRSNNDLVTFAATVNTHFNIDVKSIFGGVCHG